MTTSLIEKLQPVFNAIPFHHVLGLKLEHVDNEQIIVNFKIKEELIGNFLQGILHGGVISSVLDATGGLAVMAAAIQKHPTHSLEELANVIGKCSTIDLNIQFLTPGRGECFTAKAWIIKMGKKINFTRMELTNQENILIATGNASYLFS